MSSKIRTLIATLIAITAGAVTFAPGDHYSLNSEQQEVLAQGYQANFTERLNYKNAEVIILNNFEEIQSIGDGRTFISTISHIKPDTAYPNLVNTYYNDSNSYLAQIWLQGGVYKIFVSQGVVLFQDSNDPCNPLVLKGGLLVDASGNANIVYLPSDGVLMQNWLDIIQSKNTCFFTVQEKFTFVGSNIPSSLLGDVIWATLEQVSPSTMEKYNLYVDRHTHVSLKTLGVTKVSDITGKEVAIVSTNNGEYIVKTLPQQDELDGLKEVMRSLLSLVSEEQWLVEADRLNELVNPMFRQTTVEEIASFTGKRIGEAEVDFLNKLFRSVQTPAQAVALVEGFTAIRDMLEFKPAESVEVEE